MLKREKERKEYLKNYFKQKNDEEKKLRTIYTEKDIKEFYSNLRNGRIF